MVAACSVRGSATQGSVNVSAFRRRESRPSTAVTTLSPVAETAGSDTLAVLIAVAVGAASWLIVTVIVYALEPVCGGKSVREGGGGGRAGGTRRADSMAAQDGALACGKAVW